MPNYRKILWVLLVGLAASSSACKKAVPDSQPEDLVVGQPAPSAPMAAPVVRQSVEVAPPGVHPLAPEGVFYTLTKISKETADGVLGYPPGTRLVRQGDHFVTPDGQSMMAGAQEITNDMVLAGQAGKNDMAAQAALRKAALQALQASQTAGTAQRTANQGEPVRSTGGNLQPSGALTTGTTGSKLGGVTRVKNGMVWRKSNNGKYWVAEETTDGKPVAGILEAARPGT